MFVASTAESSVARALVRATAPNAVTSEIRRTHESRERGFTKHPQTATEFNTYSYLASCLTWHKDRNLEYVPNTSRS